MGKKKFNTFWPFFQHHSIGKRNNFSICDQTVLSKPVWALSLQKALPFGCHWQPILVVATNHSPPPPRSLPLMHRRATWKQWGKLPYCFQVSPNLGANERMPALPLSSACAIELLAQIGKFCLVNFYFYFFWPLVSLWCVESAVKGRCLTSCRAMASQWLLEKT